jgi:Mrp family chromosome partitioning ATPase
MVRALSKPQNPRQILRSSATLGLPNDAHSNLLEWLVVQLPPI